MASTKAAWGIEIGAGAIKALRLVREGDEVRVSDFAVVPYAKVLSAPDVDHDSLVRDALAQIAAVHHEHLQKEPTVVSIPGHAAFARFAKLPPVEPKKIPDIVRFEAVQQIPFPIDQVEWDYQTFTSPDSPEVEVGIFAVTKERLQSRLSLYAECGLRPAAITISPMAVFNAASFDLGLGERHKPVVLLDIGTTASDFVVAEDGRCWIRTFPVGGSHFTEAIASAFDIPYSKAERLKREGASSKYAKQLLHAMKPVFESLLEEIRRSRGYYETLHRESPLESMYAVGSTLKIPGLRRFLGKELAVEVHRFEEFKRIGVEGKAAADFAKDAVNFATAYGLALQGLGLARISVNLAPVAAIREKVWRRKAPWFAATAALLALSGGLLLVQPILGRSAVDPAGPPATVGRVLAKGQSLQQRYQQAEASAAIGATAENMITLTDWRRVWPSLVRDAYDSLDSVRPQAALLGDDPAAIRQVPAAQRRLITLREMKGAYRLNESSARQIAVTMDIETSQPDTTRFLNEAENGLLKWFRENADRPDVPYRILADSIKIPETWQTVTFGPEGAARETGNTGSGSAPAPPDDNRGGSAPFGGLPTGPRGGEGGGAGGGGGGGGGGGMMMGRRTSNEYTDPAAGGAGQQAPLQGQRKPREGPAPSGSEILAQAVISPAPSLFGDGDKLYRAEFVFVVELVDRTAAPAGAQQ